MAKIIATKFKCSHKKQSYTKVMDRGGACWAYNQCSNCGEKLPASISAAGG